MGEQNTQSYYDKILENEKEFLESLNEYQENMKQFKEHSNNITFFNQTLQSILQKTATTFFDTFLDIQQYIQQQNIQNQKFNQSINDLYDLITKNDRQTYNGFLLLIVGALFLFVFSK